MPINKIDRTGATALIPEQVSNQIIQDLPTQSVFLSLAQKLPNMTSQQLRIPVLTGLATAKFLNGDTDKKPTTNLTWDKVFITAEEIAVMVPVPDAVLDDANYDIWGEVYPRITEAFGKVIDQAAFFSTGKPTSWPEGLVKGATDAGNVVQLAKEADGPAVYQAISGEGGVLAKVEELGLAVNGFAGALQLRSKLRGAVDNNGQPIFRSAYSNGVGGKFAYELEGQEIVFPNNGSWDSKQALLLAGDFSYARYAIRQDMTFKIFDQGTITDDEGKVAISAMENDCHILRAVMRLGWALPKPVNAISGTEYYPFSVLTLQQDP